MRIFFGIAIGMVHAVQNRIGTWIQKTGALENKSHGIKNLFPKIVEGKHFMGCIPMEEKRLEKEGEEPVANQENKNNH